MKKRGLLRGTCACILVVSMLVTACGGEQAASGKDLTEKGEDDYKKWLVGYEEDGDTGEEAFDIDTVEEPDNDIVVEPDEGEQFTITPSLTHEIFLTEVKNDVFSMNVPYGWNVVGAGDGIGYMVRAYDPSEPRNQIFLILGAGPFQKSQWAREQWEAYAQMDAKSQLVADAPVLEDASTEGFYNIFPAYRTYLYQYPEYVPGLREDACPVIENLSVTERLPASDSLSSYALGESTLRATFDTGSGTAEGLITAVVTDPAAGIYEDEMFTFYRIYQICGVSAAEGDLLNWQQILTQSLGSLEFSDEFVQYTINQSQQAAENAMQLSRIGNEMMDSTMAAWENRNYSYDVTMQKQTDATLGYERVYDTENGEVYRAYEGFTDDYQGERYQPVTQDSGYLQPVDGYIEKIQ